jgi:hypothetical protein
MNETRRRTVVFVACMSMKRQEAVPARKQGPLLLALEVSTRRQMTSSFVTLTKESGDVSYAFPFRQCDERKVDGTEQHSYAFVIVTKRTWRNYEHTARART